MPIRPVELSDVPELADLAVAQREFLTPWEPLRSAAWYSVEGQERMLVAQIADRVQDRCHPFVTVVDGAIVGRITISNIARGAGQFASLGYWVAEECNGRGVATAAVADAVAFAFGELNLHRLEAGTLVHNVGSQRVLERNGFERYGLAPEMVHINGQWQDHVMFQLINRQWKPA